MGIAVTGLKRQMRSRFLLYTETGQLSTCFFFFMVSSSDGRGITVWVRWLGFSKIRFGHVFCDSEEYNIEEKLLFVF